MKNSVNNSQNKTLKRQKKAFIFSLSYNAFLQGLTLGQGSFFVFRAVQGKSKNLWGGQNSTKKVNLANGNSLKIVFVHWILCQSVSQWPAVSSISTAGLSGAGQGCFFGAGRSRATCLWHQNCGHTSPILFF